MQHQTVNLMHDGLLPRREPLVFRDLCNGALALGAALSFATVFLYGDFASAQGEVAQLASRHEALKQAGLVLREQEVVPLDQSLQSEVEALRAANRDQTRIAALLEAEHGNSAQSGFSAHLRELAEHVVDGVWLTHIQLNAGDGSSATLRGGTEEAALVPAFIRALADGEHFDGYRFANIKLQLEDDARLVFSIEGPDDR